MKNIFFRLVICNIFFIFFAFFKVRSQSDEYRIDGRLKGLRDGTVLYLTCNSDVTKGLDTIESTRSSKGRFQFNGHLNLEGKAYFVCIDTLDKSYSFLKRKYVLVHLENSNIKIRGNIYKLDPFSVLINGSSVHNDLMDYSKKYKKMFADPYDDLYAKRSEIAENNRIAGSVKSYQEYLDELNKLDPSGNVSKKIAELDKKLDSMRNSNDKLLFNKDWIRSHANSLISPYILNYLPDSLQVSLFRELTAKAKGGYYGVRLENSLARDREIAIGKRAPDIILTTSEGEKLSLHWVAEQNKLTIVDFWAYWCKPCRKSFSDLKELYNKYQSKGLGIYSVSIDPRKERWLLALKEEKLPWYNVIVPESEPKERSVKEIYDVSSIPYYLLLDQDGKILLKWRGGENSELVRYLSNL